MSSLLYVIRGLPGSGKTTFGRRIASRLNSPCRAADDFFETDEGEYVFHPEDLPLAHEACLRQVQADLALFGATVVTNVFNKWEHVVPYLGLATTTVVIHLYDGGCTDAELAERNVHAVPLSTIKKMRASFERKPTNW